MNLNLDGSSIMIIVTLGGILFNAGITWGVVTANMKSLRRDINGFKSHQTDHEAWAHNLAEEYSGRVARLEGERHA